MSDFGRRASPLLPALLLVGLASACQRQPGPPDAAERTAPPPGATVSADPARNPFEDTDAAPGAAGAVTGTDAAADADATPGPEAPDPEGLYSEGLYSEGPRAQPEGPQPEGVFTGILPCEDCPGLETTLYLHADGGYELVEREGDHAPVSRRHGVWYSSADGHAILIADDENGTGHHIFEWYGDDALRLLPDEPRADWDDTFLLVRAN